MSERQKDIVHAALTIIGEEGMGKLTIRNVARRVGFSEPAVYRHFSDKTNLLAVMLEYVSDMMGKHFAEARSGEGGGREVLGRFLRRMFVEFAELPALVPLLFTDELLHQDPKLEQRVQSTVETQLSRMVGLVVSLQKSGEWRSDIDPDDAATMILGTIRLSVVRLANHAQPVKSADRVAGLLNSLMQANGGEPS